MLNKVLKNTLSDRQTMIKTDRKTNMQVLTEGRRPPVCSEACLCSWGWGCTAWCTSLTVAARDTSGSAGSPWDLTAPASTRQTQHSPSALTGVTLSLTCQSYITTSTRQTQHSSPALTGVTLSPTCQSYITSVNKADTALSTSADRSNTITNLSELHHQCQQGRHSTLHQC